MSQENENLKELIVRLEKARDWLVECKLYSEEIEKNGSSNIKQLQLLGILEPSLTSVNELIEKVSKYANAESMKKAINSQKFQDLITNESVKSSQILPFLSPFKRKYSECTKSEE